MAFFYPKGNHGKSGGLLDAFFGNAGRMFAELFDHRRSEVLETLALSQPTGPILGPFAFNITRPRLSRVALYTKTTRSSNDGCRQAFRKLQSTVLLKRPLSSVIGGKRVLAFGN